ncbi:hypothetical protein ACQP2F_28575 [Actinoplanes sp. CA-030573]|uniref:hypothetical protein n=1 Tax=Actinoplanes sp. CA-030573 TaxID=3239898 RepID=UPI003D8ADCDC
MSLSSLRSLNGAASLATTAFDTARSTLKAMAEAAVPPAGEGEGATGSAGQQKRPAPQPAAEGLAKASPSPSSPSPEKAKRGIRKGTVLDAYA